MEEINSVIDCLSYNFSTVELIAILRNIANNEKISDGTFTIFAQALSKSMKE